MMGLLDRLRKTMKVKEEEEYEAALERETSKVKAYRTAEEVAEAAKVLMEKALELRAEIEAMSDE